MSNTIVLVSDRNYLWGVWMIIVSMRKNGMNEPVLVQGEGYTESDIAILKQFADVTVLNRVHGSGRNLCCSKPDIMLLPDTDYVTWADCDAIFFGNCSRYLTAGPEHIHVEMRGERDNAGVFAKIYEPNDIHGGIPAKILYDNIKNVVIDRKEGKVNFNVEFVHFARHYGFTPKACPPYSPWVKGKVERSMDYIRERFWRGYTFTSLATLNRDMRIWLDETANKRIHGTHQQPVIVSWLEEMLRLGALPASDYDTSIKLYRKVYKDCQVSYNTNRYLVPHLMVGKKILLKIKNGVIRIFHDQDLLVTYQEAEGKHTVVGNRLFYEQLKRDQEQNRRKYGKSKGKATRGLTTSSLFPQVEQRPTSDYGKFSQGGVSWNN